MKNTLLLLTAFLLLGGLAFWMVNDNDKPLSTVNVKDRDFAVEDINEVGKIFIADRQGKTSTLTREGDAWKINGKYKVRRQAIQSLLDVIGTVEMAYIPPKATIPGIVETLSSHGLKVEVYDRKDEVMKTYYVGGMTNDETGTYMIMEGAEQPYVMRIPTMTGSLRVRFIMNENDWRDRHVYGWEPEEIDYVSVEYPKQKNKSFILEKANGNYSVRPFYEITPKINRPYIKGSGESYLIGFEKFISENIINDYRHKDSISQLTPFAILTVKSKGETQITNYHPIRPIGNNGLPITDEMVSTNTAVERYHVNHSSGDFYLVQQRNFGRAFWSYESFFEKAGN